MPTIQKDWRLPEIEKQRSKTMRVNDTVEGSQLKTYWTESDGTWQAITIPAAVRNSRHVYIQVHNGSSSYAHSAVEFEVSSESDGTGWVWVTEITLGIGVDDTETVCYVKASTGQKIAVMILR